MKIYQWVVIVGLGVVIVLGGVFLMQGPVTSQVADLPLIDPSQQGQPTYTNATPDDIIVTLPFPGAVTGKTFSVLGKARGPWFFEASFPVRVLDKDGNQIAVAVAAAEGEWMTTDFVEFKANITVPESYIGPATLVLKKDNPSGEPEHDASVSFPLTIEY